jgi:hypothetical protein
MMHTIASRTSENRMTASAVAACMAPLLLRPLLAGECEMDEVFDMDGDDSAQLLAAANAANSAQGIITTLLEDYENIFDVRVFICSSIVSLDPLFPFCLSIWIRRCLYSFEHILLCEITYILSVWLYNLAHEIYKKAYHYSIG